jgi:2-keto-4-pentenoate hydratase
MRIIGWKAGFGSAAAMERLGTTAPLFGLLTDATLLEPGATVSLDGWTNPLLEPELAIYLDSGGGIAAVGAAIELVDLRTQTDDPAEILAGNIYHRHVLLGRERANSPDGLTAKVHRDGELVAETDDPQALNGRLDDVVRLLHETVGDRVRPGDVVIAGSVVAPIAIALGQQIRYDLAPLGSLTVLLR